MASRRGDAKSEVEKISVLFAPLLHKKITFTFGKFSFPIIIQEIRLGKTTGLTNAPDKRKDDKFYIPPIMEIVTNEGMLRFVVEDIEIVSIVGGLRIITAANNIDFKEA